MSKYEFKGDGTDFSATHDAEKWCKENGYSVGSMQRGDPRGIMRGDWSISKWRNLSVIERAGLDGVMEGPGRNGPIIVTIFDDTKVTGDGDE